MSIRHRWLSLIFSAITHFVVRIWGEPQVVHAPPPLFLLLFSGLSLFARPYRSQPRLEASP